MNARLAALRGPVRAAGVVPLVQDAAPFVEAARRAGEHGEFLFLLNHSDTETAAVIRRGPGRSTVDGQ